MSGPTASINLISTDPIQLFLSIILTGGIIAGTYEWIRYYLNKRREEAVDMAKHKMDVLMKLLPIYIPLGTYYGSLSVELDPKRGIAPDKKRCFFYICKILILQKCIFDRGGLQLGNLDAEEILTDLGYNIVTAIRKEFGYDMIADLQRLVSQKSQYDSYLAKLNRESKANPLYI